MLFIQVGCNAKNVLYVSTVGNDTNIGSFHAPLQTMGAALTLSRKEHVKTIVVRGGKYYNVGMYLTKSDSGLVIKNYKTERVVLFGGALLSSFYNQGHLLVTCLPNEVTTDNFQMILVNGTWREHSRLPESGSFKYLNEWKVKSLPSYYGGWERKPTEEEKNRLRCNGADFVRWMDDYKNAEISLTHQWDESYSAIDSINKTQQLVYLHLPAIMPLGSYAHNDYVVWNTKQGMTHAGQWYVDKAERKIYYWPLPNEKVSEIVVPVCRSMIVFERGARDITIKGLTLCASGNKLQEEYFAGIGIDPLISASGVSDVHLQHLNIMQTNGAAIKLQGKHNVISYVNMHDCGAGGIYFGGEDVIIDNCRLNNLGLLYRSSVGIQGNGKRVFISHCSISHVPYSGMSVDIDSGVISHCNIKYIMQSLLDGGAIYCGISNMVHVDRNYIFNNNEANRFVMGIYFDEQCHDCTARNNIVINTGIPVHCHMAKNICYTDNIFIDNKTQNINTGKSFAISLSKNVFIAPIINFSGPSVFDAQVDTLKLETKYRKYANPTGITSFKENAIFCSSPKDIKLPLTPEKSDLWGTKANYMDGETINSLLYKGSSEKKCIKHYNVIKKRYLSVSK